MLTMWLAVEKNFNYTDLTNTAAVPDTSHRLCMDYKVSKMVMAEQTA